MSKTGSVHDNTHPGAQALTSRGAELRARAWDRDVAESVFSEHVLALVGVAERDPARLDITAAAPGEAAAATTTGHGPAAEPDDAGVVLPRLANASQEAILRLNESHASPETALAEGGAKPALETKSPDAGISSTALPAKLSDAPEALPDQQPPRNGAQHDIARTNPLDELQTATSSAGEQSGTRSRPAQPERAAPLSRAGHMEQVALRGKDTVGSRAAAPANQHPIRIVRQETHLPPPQRLPPVMQIAGALASGLDGGDAVRTLSTSPGAAAKSPSSPVIRVLHIRLEPPELGTVTVRMKLDANALELHVEAQRAATAELIRRDQGTLARLLQATGYDVEGLTVHIADPDRTAFASATHAQPGGSQASPQSSPQGQSDWSQPDGRPGGEPGNPRNGRASTQATTADAAEPAHAGGSKPVGVYV